MPPSNITIVPATEDDASSLASIMTLAFASSDAAYPLIWGGAGDAVHEDVALKGLFTPVLREGRVTHKAMDGERMVGFAKWLLPDPNEVKKEVKSEASKEPQKKGHGLPEIPGVNTELWGGKVEGPRDFYHRDADPSKDMLLSFFFVHPDYQKQGIGSSLLQWGLKKADELVARLWVTGTPQAVSTYERNGWKAMERCDVDLRKYGGEGIYSRAWMVREPKVAV